jgi:hypothetical protein
MPTRCRNCRLDVRLLDMSGGFHSSHVTSTPNSRTVQLACDCASYEGDAAGSACRAALSTAERRRENPALMPVGRGGDHSPRDRFASRRWWSKGKRAARAAHDDQSEVLGRSASRFAATPHLSLEGRTWQCPQASHRYFDLFSEGTAVPEKRSTPLSIFLMVRMALASKDRFQSTSRAILTPSAARGPAKLVTRQSAKSAA